MRFWRRNVPSGPATETEESSPATAEETALRQPQPEPDVGDTEDRGPPADLTEPIAAPEPGQRPGWLWRRDIPAAPTLETEALPPSPAEAPLPETVLRPPEPEIEAPVPSSARLQAAPAAPTLPTERQGGLWRRILAQPAPEAEAPPPPPEEITALRQPEPEIDEAVPPAPAAPSPPTDWLRLWRLDLPAKTTSEIEAPPATLQQETTALRPPEPKAEPEIEERVPPQSPAAPAPPALPVESTDHGLWLWRGNRQAETSPEIEAPPPQPQEQPTALHQPQPEPEIVEAPPAPEPTAPLTAPSNETEHRRGWFTRLRAGLSRSSARLNEGINTIFNRRRLDDEALEELEELLISSDMGVGIASEVTESLRRTRFNQEVSPEEVRAALADQVIRLIEPVTRPLRIDRSRKPFVILVIGVNGSGKTTTIAKLAKQYRDEGLRVVLAAGDTFRAAAVEQLQVWGERTGCAVVTRPAGADAAGLAYDALVQAQGEAADVLLIDTAGRLHNKADLMGELQKIVRVVKKVDANAPHSVLLVLDATTGQNAHAQAETFRDMVGVTGIVMTKLDGTARGGVLVSLAEKYGIPIHAIGVGETADDLRPFEARAYARSLVGLEP